MTEKKRSESFFRKSFSKNYFIREKASLLIYLMISLSFFVQMPKDVFAQSNQQACCEKTKSGDYCVYTEKNNCDTSNGLKTNNARCEQSSFCANVCCVSSDNSCLPNTPSPICSSQNGKSFNDASCNNVKGCVQGCCIIGNQNSFRSENECKSLATSVFGSNYNLNDVFKQAGSEIECLDLNLKEQEGCCIDEDVCSFGKRNSCEGQFKLNRKCSQLNECRQKCQARNHKDCYEGSVYWFDSCGNREELSEQCNYEEGKLCGKENGNVICKDLDCKDTTSYPEWSYTGGSKEHGEGWCIYDGPTGNFTDRPGGIHYRIGCQNGEEIVEPCLDFRKEVCIQAHYDDTDFSTASCIRNNIYDSKLTSNITSVGVGFKFWEQNNKNKDQCKTGSTECTVYYVKKNNVDDYDCKANCECESQQFLDEANTYCKSFGDCGFSYNIVEEKGSSGLNIFWSEGGRGEKPNKLSSSYLAFLKKYGIYGGMEFLNAEFEKIIDTHRDTFGLSDTSKNLYTTSIILSTLSFVIIGVLTYGIGILDTIILVATVVVDTVSVISAGGGFAAITEALTAAAAGSAATGYGIIVAIVLLIIAALIAITAAVIGEGDVKKKTVTIECLPWQAPKGGANCGRCDDDINKPCTEYRCRSLGTTCEIINEGTEKVECIDNNPNDIKAPKITPFVYGTGYTITKEKLGYKFNQEIKSLSKFTFGFKTDEVSLCKYAFNHSIKYESMDYTFGDSFFKKEHNMSLVLEQDKEFKYYVRCEDMKGNSNQADYLIKFKTDKGPDLEVPIILETNLKNNAIVANNIKDLLFELEMSEPSYCRYDIRDGTYDSFGKIALCDDEFSRVPKDYKCTTAFSGLKEGLNSYYFRCRDLVNNTYQQSRIYTFIRSKPLTIMDVNPKGNLFVNDITLDVTTAGGSENGKAICKYKLGSGGFNEFKETNSNRHLQSQINLRKGNYKYNVECIDNAGNTNKTIIDFSIAVERKGDEIVNIYKDNSRVYVITDVAADCEYNKEDFTLGNGIKMRGDGTTVHSSDIELSQVHIKCKDDQGKELKGIIVNI